MAQTYTNKFWIARIGNFLTTFKITRKDDHWQYVFHVPPDLENRRLGYLMVLEVQGNKVENIPFVVEYMSSFRDDIPSLTIISREDLYQEYGLPCSIKIGTIIQLVYASALKLMQEEIWKRIQDEVTEPRVIYQAITSN